MMCSCRLRRELQNRKQIISEQARRIAELESTLAAVRHNENVTRSMDDVAANKNRSDVSVELCLKISPKITKTHGNIYHFQQRAARNEADEYKKQVMQLTIQVEELRQENEILKEEGAVGGSSSNTHYNTRPIPQSQQLAKELMLAASTAETNLRLVNAHPATSLFFFFDHFHINSRFSQTIAKWRRKFEINGSQNRYNRRWWSAQERLLRL